jgi:hypothetical protein
MNTLRPIPITLTDADGDRQVNGAVDFGTSENPTWVTNAIDAAWNYCRYTGAESITVRSNDSRVTDGQDTYVRIATVSCILHDE